MANAAIDGNHVKSLLAVLNTDGATVTRVYASPVDNGLSIDDNTGGSDNGPSPARALRDANGGKTIMAVSSSDGISLVPLYVTSAGLLLINSN